jgi:hypothetical protein
MKRRAIAPGQFPAGHNPVGPEKNPQIQDKRCINNGLEILPAGQEMKPLSYHGGRVVYADYFHGMETS